MANPSLIPQPFANNGKKNTIQNTRQNGQDIEDATWNDGFPPVTMQPPEVGGLAPKGLDFNGVLNILSASIMFAQQGGRYQFDPSMCPYPKGAIILSNDSTREFQSTTDNNSNNPNNNMSGWKVYSGVGFNADTASKLSNTRTVNLSGDANGIFTYDGSGDSNCTVTLRNVAAGVGTFGSNIQIPSVTVNAKGLVMAISQQEVRTANTNQTGIVQLSDNLTTDDDSKALTARQGKKLQDQKVSRSGDTFTGAVNFANNTWNLMGDDVAIGDVNISGALGVKGQNDNGSIVFFDPYNKQTGSISGTSFSGNATTASRLQYNKTITLNGVVKGSAAFDGSNDFTIKTRNDITTLTTDRDINTVTDDGIYFVSGNFSTFKNGAAINDFGFLKVTNRDNSSWILQEFWSDGVITAYVARFTTNGGKDWKPWGSIHNAVTADKLTNARKIAGVSFDGTGDIDLAGVNKTGNQDTTGNATTASRWQYNKTISFNGVMKGSASFDGSSDFTIKTKNDITPLPNSQDLNTLLDEGIYFINSAFSSYKNANGITDYGFLKVTNQGSWVLQEFWSDGALISYVARFSINGGKDWKQWSSVYNAVTADRLSSSRSIGGVGFNGSNDINLPGVNQKGNQDTTGNADSATRLKYNQTIALSGLVKGSVSFNGSSDVLIKTRNDIKTLDSNQDINNVTDDGIYFANKNFSTYKNAPNISDFGLLEVTNQGSWVLQEFKSDGNVTAQVTRFSTNGGSSWKAWSSIHNAVTADKLTNSRNFNISGCVLGNGSFNGSNDLNLVLQANESNLRVTQTDNYKITYDDYRRIAIIEMFLWKNQSVLSQTASDEASDSRYKLLTLPVSLKSRISTSIQLNEAYTTTRYYDEASEWLVNIMPESYKDSGKNNQLFVKFRRWYGSYDEPVTAVATIAGFF